LALRELRDSAGFDAKTVQAIAAENNIPKSTLWAAMRGQRIPSTPVLAALVRAWGGDEAEWARRRTRVENEIEQLRQAKPAIAECRPDQPMSYSLFAGSNIGQTSKDSERAETYSRLKAVLLGQAPNPEEARKAAIDRRLRRLAAEKTVEMNSGDDLVAVVLGQHDALLWDVLREQAGHPTLRQISSKVGIHQAAVGLILKGGRNNDREGERVCRYLVARRDRLARRASDE
jgi:transcriptional regulator with XRE-family HTH domain